MDNKKLTIGAAALTALVISAGMATSSFAYQGNPEVEGPNFTPERHAEMTAAFEATDYTAWTEARGDVSQGRMMDVVNADNFNLFVEMREARLEGDTDRVAEIRTELGLGQGSMMKGENGHRGGGQGSGNGESKGSKGSGTRGQNTGGSFVDANGDGVCDRE